MYPHTCVHVHVHGQKATGKLLAMHRSNHDWLAGCPGSHRATLAPRHQPAACRSGHGTCLAQISRQRFQSPKRTPKLAASTCVASIHWTGQAAATCPFIGSRPGKSLTFFRSLRVTMDTSWSSEFRMSSFPTCCILIQFPRSILLVGGHFE